MEEKAGPSFGSRIIAALVLAVAAYILLKVVIGFAAGYWLDGVLGTKPWLSFLGFFLGLAAGVLNVYRVMQLADKGGKRSRESSRTCVSR